MEVCHKLFTKKKKKHKARESRATFSRPPPRSRSTKKYLMSQNKRLKRNKNSTTTFAHKPGHRSRLDARKNNKHRPEAGSRENQPDPQRSRNGS